ncbi:Tn3 family transposase (plasmid) [Paraclostridium bifermentans]|uniref:Tn3 family transposase n=1 Tax=Paraclostridium bifermentans TaxID=1490 RepID=A0A5P3XKK6_PARBF|nr:Tn3 family transposase [Paraclostridium bifermentans]QEZ70812.1 Tn3 family transposase [Paraclostridium bifermentans]
MMNSRYSVLSTKEKNNIIQTLISEKNITTDFYLTDDEIHMIKKFDRPYISLGYALQYIYLKNRGISILNYSDSIPKEVIEHISLQLKCSSKELKSYFLIRNTKARHMQEIFKVLNYTKFELNSKINNVAHEIVLYSSNKFDMVKRFIDYLKINKIAIPTISTIEGIISKNIFVTDEFIYKNIYSQLKNKEILNKLLYSESNGISTFSRIKNTSVNVSSNGIKELLKLIKEINEYGEMIDLSFLSDEKIRYLNSQIQKSHKTRIERFKDNHKKYSYLAMFLYFKKKELMDMVIEVISNHVHMIQKRSKKRAQEYNAKNQSIYKSDREKFKLVIKDLLNISDFKEFINYQNTSLVMIDNELNSHVDDLDEVDFLLKSYPSIDYINDLLEIIKFDSNTKPELVDFLKNYKNSSTRKNKKIDISFFEPKWQKSIKKYEYSKKVVGMTVMNTIRDSIRSGDLFVRASKKYNSFDHYLISPTESSCDIKSIEFFNNLKQSIQIPKQFELNRDIEHDEKSTFSDKIYRYFPNISMPEILYEVNQWTSFLEDFRGFHGDKLDKQKVLVASLLADGHNLGFAKMAIASGIDESVLRRSSEYYLNYDNLETAQKTLVNYHHSLDIVGNWGNGKSSSSDGMRVPINSKTIYADYNAHYGNRGGGIYRHVSDQYTPYYVQILEGRDSNHVLDGLLYHDTSLEIYNHSTDTAGYTEQMFALTYLLGFNFKPRIKNLTQQQLYAFESFEMDDIKFKKINEKIILDNYSEVMRLVESIRCGKVKASLILQKINSYNRNNAVAKGLKEIGRILKTKYIIDYYTNGDLRKEVQKMLNKGEAINSVARLIFFGKQGRLNESKLERQLEKVSCLNILLSSLIIWNSRYLEKVYTEVKDEDWFNEEEFKRVSPLGTAHVNFLGRYILEDFKITTKDGLRELELKAPEY